AQQGRAPVIQARLLPVGLDAFGELIVFQ
ncbi:MAG: hypothetical protein ACI841_004392, partial [Planctomycetota bacterium]